MKYTLSNGISFLTCVFRKKKYCPRNAVVKQKHIISRNNDNDTIFLKYLTYRTQNVMSHSTFEKSNAIF